LSITAGICFRLHTRKENNAELVFFIQHRPVDEAAERIVLPNPVEKSPVSLHRRRHFRGAFRPLLLYGRSGRLNDRLRFMAGSQN